MEMENVIQINDLTVHYGHHQALDCLSLSVRKGEIFGFLGPNGAGKSTTIKTLLGLIRPSAGSVRLQGLAPADIRSRARVGYLPEEATYYRFLTPAETLGFYGEIFNIPGTVLKERIARLLAMVGLEDVRDRPIHTFSKGMTQKLSLAQALINDPDTLILDEPMSGLDPLARLDLRHTLSRLRGEGKTLFLSSHELSEVELLCDRMAILQGGHVVCEGTLTDIVGRTGGKSLETFFVETVRGGRRQVMR